MNYPNHVKLVEVGPRDGLQNEPGFVPTDTKVRLIEKLSDCGLQMIEAGAFVSPKWVPQMADSAEVFSRIKKKPNVIFSALAPNMKGFQDAVQAGADEVAIFAAASESFSQKNINCTIEQSFERFLPVVAAAKAAGVPVRGYVSCVLDCPYEGPIAASKVAAVSLRLIEAGCYEVSLGDTIGKGTPLRALELIDEVAKVISRQQIAVHFHDTYGQAIANIHAVLQQGVAIVDSSVAGLGGCPYAKGASGNVATEDVLYLLSGLGIATGVDMVGLLQASSFISEELGRKPASKVALAAYGAMEKIA